jgi:flagellar motor switch protein FliN
MADGSLSQDEIDALLQGGGGMDFGGGEAAGSGGSGSALSDQEKNRLSQILSEVTGSQASNLSGMIDESVDLKAPTVEILSAGEVGSGLPDSLVEIKIDYSDGISGEHSYLIPEDMAIIIAGKMMGQEGVELNEAALSAIEEAANTMAGSSATVIGDSIGKTVMNSPGDTKLSSSGELRLPAGDSLVRVTYPFTIDDAAPSHLYELFSIEAAKAIAGGGESGAGASPGAAQPDMSMGGMNMGDMNMGGMNMGNMGQMNAGGGGFGGGQASYNQANVQPVQFPPLNPQGGGSEQGNIGLLMDVYMEMTVELGRTRRLIKDILGMGEGTIIELDKLAGEPVDILVNHKLIAKGEVVVIDENFGVRVTEIVSPMDRVEGFS